MQPADPRSLLRRALADYRGVGWVLGVMAVALLALASAIPENSVGIWWRQLGWFGLGLTVLVVTSRIDYRWLGGNAGLLLGLVAGLLVLVYGIGTYGGGSRRWLSLGPFNVQPSELAKITVVLWTAAWASRHPRVRGAGLRELMVPGVVILTVAGLVVVQPDLGTALAIAFDGFAVLLVAGIAWRVLVAVGAGGAVGAGIGWVAVLQPYQKRRVIAFLDPGSDPLGSGYHTIQSKIAVGAGGVWGAGFGEGTQTALRFLPEQHTDFIFSVWAEEWGLIGGLCLLALYAGLFRWTARTAIEARDALGRLLATGVLAHLALHVGVNIAMVVGLAPVVGLPLPWMTYGGSAVLVNCVAIGLVVSIRLRRHMFQPIGVTTRF